MSRYYCPQCLDEPCRCMEPTTRATLRWHWTAAGLVELARLCVLGAVLVALDGACGRVERWIDGRAGR